MWLGGWDSGETPLTLLRIVAPYFVAGVVVEEGIVVRAAPIVGYMVRGRWTRTRVWAYCQTKRWALRRLVRR